MAMMPKRVKFRKSQRGKMTGVATRGNTVAFGEYGLQRSSPHGSPPARSKPVVWRACTFCVAKAGCTSASSRTSPCPASRSKFVWAAVRANRVLVRVVKPGTILFEIQGVEEKIAKQALARVAIKMPIATRFVTRKHAIG